MTDAKSAPEKPATKPTRYEISEAQPMTDGPPSWKPVTVVEAFGARAALKAFVEGKPASWTGGTFRAIPVSNITQVDAKIETQRKLTLA